jgi:hypothetical protein
MRVIVKVGVGVLVHRAVGVPVPVLGRFDRQARRRPHVP